MKWSLKLGRILGVDVYLHITFLLLMALIASAHALAGGSVVAALKGASFFGALFLCVLLHELGHALAARRYGIPTRDITLLPIGGVASLERIPSKPSQELWVAVAGPAVNVVIATCLLVGILATGEGLPLNPLDATSGTFAERLLAANAFLVLFNLLPAFPMDGGRVLRALLAMRLNYLKATRIATRVGQGMAVVFGIVALLYNPLLLIIAFFVWAGASQEARAAEVKHTVAGIPVRAAMLTDFVTLQREDRLDRATEFVLRGWQQDFPVMDGGEVIGVLTRDDLLNGLRTLGPSALVTAVMRSDFLLVHDGESLEAAVFEKQAQQFSIVPVIRNNRLVGLLTSENFGEYLAIRNALASRRLPV